MNSAKGIAREPQRREITGLPRTTWWRLRKLGLVPAPVRLAGERLIGWRIEDLERWVESREQLPE